MNRRRSPRRSGARGAVLLPVLLALCVSAAGCAPSDDALQVDEARPVTMAEAELLALTRFRNLDQGTRRVAFTVTDGGETLVVDGWFDFTTSTGYAATAVGGVPRVLLLWNDRVVGEHEAVSAVPPLPIVDRDQLETRWTGGALDPSASRLHAVLAVIGSLGTDRPDNPLLLQQTGALWLGRAADSGGEELTVFAGPPSETALPEGESADPEAAKTRFWLDDTGRAHRVDLRVGGDSEWTVIRFSDAAGVSLGAPLDDAQDASR